MSRSLLISIDCPPIRTMLGRLRLIELHERSDEVLFGPVDCNLKADNKAAAAKGNSDRNPALPFGDTPLGLYNCYPHRVTGTTANGDLRKLGPHGWISLDPQEGQALAAKQNGRHGLLIHGGEPSPSGGLRPTFGCVRLANSDMAALQDAIRAHEPATVQCRVEEMESSPT